LLKFIVHEAVRLPVLVTLLGLLAALLVGERAADAEDIQIQGPVNRPHLLFACCNHGISAAQHLFADPDVIHDLRALDAGIVLDLPDFSPERRDLVHQLNSAGVPLVAWIEIPGEHGPYFNAGDIPEAFRTVETFEHWSSQNSLVWHAVGLDIEPDFTELARLKGHSIRLVQFLIQRYFDRRRVIRARSSYGTLIHQLQSQGYFVQTYQFPFIVTEREENSTLLERLLGIVNVRGNQEALMLYLSYAPATGEGMIWKLGPSARAIAIGNTQRDPNAGSWGTPLDWDVFSRDLRVAAHFSSTIGVFNLEGCIQQDFLKRLLSMDWNQPVLMPAAATQRAGRLILAARVIVWTGSWLPLILATGVGLLAGTIWFRRRRRAHQARRF
jgi:hypothetical protein